MSFVIRQAELGDAAGIAGVHVESWKTTYPGIVPDAFLASLDTKARTQSWREQLTGGATLILVAVDKAEIIGFACGGPIREPTADYDAELYAIYVLLGAQRQGAGRLLFHAVAAGLHASGFKSLLLWVLEANPSESFYRHLGGIRVAQKMIQIGGADLPEIALGWPEINRLIDAE